MGSAFIVRKLGGALLTLAAIAVLNFFLFRMLPGDPVNSLLPRNVSQAQKQALRLRLGLDQPIFPGIIRAPTGGLSVDLTTLPDSLLENQFLTSTGNLLVLDLGMSFSERKPVTEVITDHLWPTVLLVGTAEVVSLIVGIWIGIRAGWRRGSRFDTLSINGSLVLYAVPLFWLGMLLFYFFATPNGIALLPGQQMITPGMRHTDPLAYWVDVLRHLILPATTLALGLIAGNALIMRSSMVETLKDDYVTTARAKGLTDSEVVRRHAIPNALLPTVTVVALTFGYVLGGAIGVEEVYSWPGMGSLIIDSIHDKDFPVLQGIFLVIALCVVIANLIADILYGVLDPRVRT